MTAHAVVEVTIGRPAAEVFAVVHDYPHRLEWDTLLRKAVTERGADPAIGVVAACSARWWLGGYTFRTRYVTFTPPELAAVTLLRPVFVFDTWAASIRHRDIPGPAGPSSSTLTYTLTFRCRPQLLAKPLEAWSMAAFRYETNRRLRALKKYLET